MSSILPAPAHSKTRGRIRLPSVLSCNGPEWTTRVLPQISGKPPWPVVQSGATSGEEAAGITVDAPSEVMLAPRELPNSSYQMDIAESGIRVRCAEPGGLVQALRLLGQLAGPGGWPTPDGNSSQAIEVPVGRFADAPRFSYRGIHLDVCRHFFDADFVKRLLLLMASLGFNVFHWHLTDDQGWRIPIRRFPRLTEVGAFRTEPDGSRYGGYYSQSDIRTIVKLAGALGILVMPEIELPGHARAAIAAYPQLSCLKESVDVWSQWGVCDDVFCAGNEYLFDFLEGVLDEVVAYFPSRFIHIGGDECPRTRWRECPECGHRITAEHLTDYDQLQSYVVDRTARLLQVRERTAVGWDEILEGGLPRGTVVMSWRGTSGGVRAANAGHQVIMTPTSHCYFDYRQSDESGAPGFPHPDESGQAPLTTVRDVYAFDPRQGLSDRAADNVLGGQANVWTEYMESSDAVERMIAPRILAMSEVLWSYPAPRDFESFRPRARAALAQLDRMGWHYGSVTQLGDGIAPDH